MRKKDLEKVIKDNWQLNTPDNYNEIKNKCEFNTSYKHISKTVLSKKISIGICFSVCLIFILSFTIFNNFNVSNKNNAPNDKQIVSFGSINSSNPHLDVKEMVNLTISNNIISEYNNEFALFFNNLNLTVDSKIMSKEEVLTEIANCGFLTVKCHNETYLLFFTNNDFVIIFYGNYYYQYQCPNALLKYCQFLEQIIYHK